MKFSNSALMKRRVATDDRLSGKHVEVTVRIRLLTIVVLYKSTNKA